MNLLKHGILLAALALAAPAQASLLTDVSFDRVVSVVERTQPVFYNSGNLIGTSANIPLLNVASQVNVSGGSMIADYNFTDNGTVAMFAISTAFDVSGSYGASEHGGDIHVNSPIIFKTTNAVNYTIQASHHDISNTGQGFSSVVAVLESNQGRPFYINSGLTDFSTVSESGTLFANTIYSFTTASGAGLSNLSGNIRGNAQVILTLTDATVTPVPLPAAVWLFGSALAGFVGFNRRKPLQQAA